ncbi:MAG: hypothetical protein EPO12_16455 [Aquabacterium sp.]|nr:MAG: hypothetical protein EPO12_16455 [Aquabacterium sp.]
MDTWYAGVWSAQPDMATTSAATPPVRLRFLFKMVPFDVDEKKPRKPEQGESYQMKAVARFRSNGPRPDPTFIRHAPAPPLRHLAYWLRRAPANNLRAIPDKPVPG